MSGHDAWLFFTIAFLGNIAWGYVGYRLGADRMLRSMGHIMIVRDDDGRVKHAFASPEPEEQAE